MAKSSRKKPSTAAPVPTAPAQRGETVEFTQDEIGGELVSLLSEGLYTNPLDALREYIQNSIDASAKKVTLKFTGRSLFIRDNGDGMTREQLVKARRLAVSEKSLATNIGFRGIGIYSAFHLCDNMRMKTKVSGVFEQHVAEFDFKSMREILAAERGSGKSERTPLTKLLTEHVRFWSEENAFEDSTTTIELHNILPLYYATLSSRAHTEKYLLDTIPVNFPPGFKMGEQINADIRASWSEYRPISIVLSYPGESDYPVVKKMPSDLIGPMTLDVESPTGQKIAMIWGCRTNKNEMIGKTEPEFREMQGFAYKVKGVTVGGRAESQRAFSQGALYNWWTGEIWVLNNLVVPNAGRDDFEYNAASRELRVAVWKTLKQFERDSSIFQQTRRARENLDAARNEYDRLFELSLKGILTPRDLGDLANTLDKVNSVSRALQKFESTDASIAERRAECRLLADKIGLLIKAAELGAPPETGGGKRRRASPSQNAQANGSDSAEETAVDDTRTLGDMIAALDLSDPTVAHEVPLLLVAAIEDVVAPSSDAYREIAEAFEAKLDELDLI